jgi:hypothetical protein
VENQMTEKKLTFSTKREKDWLRTLLHESVVGITFTKKDGSERLMKCTLLESKIPSEFTPKGSEKAKSDEVLPVFDVENDGWRSFRWDSITKIEFSLVGDVGDKK